MVLSWWMVLVTAGDSIESVVVSRIFVDFRSLGLRSVFW